MERKKWKGATVIRIEDVVVGELFGNLNIQANLRLFII